MFKYLRRKFSKAKESEPNTSVQTIVMDYERTPDFLKEHHYLFLTSDDEAEYYGKTIRSSATIQTDFGTLNVPMGAIRLFVRKEQNNTYRFGIHNGKNGDVSDLFAEEVFKQKLETFEARSKNEAWTAK